ARSIAAQVFAEDRRKNVLSCAPRAPTPFDKPCATQFIQKYGRLLYRRPLEQAEINSLLALANAIATQSGDFYQGLQAALSRLPMSPALLFRVGQVDPQSIPRGVQQLDDYSLATRISFLLWEAPPDEELLDAAAHGTLRSKAGVLEQ